MRVHTTIEDEQARLDFTRKAAESFASNPKAYSFGELTPGSFLALRWGLGEDCVMLLKLDEDHVPTVFGQAIKKEAAHG